MWGQLQRHLRARRTAALVCACLAPVLAGCGGGGGTATAQQAQRTIVWAAGNPLDLPVYEEAANRLGGAPFTLNLQELPNSAAMHAFRDGTLAFVAAEGRLPSQLSVASIHRAASTAILVPVARIGEAVIYNLPTVKAPLRLDSALLAGIFQGRITTWNDRRIARLNPKVTLPALPIRVVERTDADPGTAILTRYIAAGSASWRRKVGTGETVQWPGGTLDDGNASLLTTVSGTVGSIGYTPESVVLQNGLKAAALRAQGKAFIAPTEHVLTTGSYPLTASEYVLTYSDLCDAGQSPSKSAATQRLLSYLLGPGQALASELYFAPLPAGARNAALHLVRQMQCGGQPLS